MPLGTFPTRRVYSRLRVRGSGSSVNSGWLFGRRVNGRVFGRWNISRGVIFRRGDGDRGVFWRRRKVNSGGVFCTARGIWKTVDVVSHVAVEARPLTGDARPRTHVRAPGQLLGQLCIHFRCPVERSGSSAQRTGVSIGRVVVDVDQTSPRVQQFDVAELAAAVSVGADNRVPHNSPTNKSHGQTCTDMLRRAQTCTVIVRKRNKAAASHQGL